MSSLIPTFLTAVNTWQCDENAHLNVQYYTEFAHEASAHLLAHLGLGPQAQRAAGLESRPIWDHVRYLRELMVVDPVAVRSAPVETGERHLVAYHEIRNQANGEVAATVTRRLECTTPWPRPFLERARSACMPLPATARRRSVGTLELPTLTLDTATKLGLIEIGRTTVKPAECDEGGAFLPRHQFGRYSDGAPVLWNHLGFDRAGMQARQEGTIVVEMLNHYRAALVAGDLVVVMSGLADFSDRILKFTHFLFEGESGTLVACAEAVGMKFDQKARRIVAFSDEDRTRLSQRKVQLHA